MFLFLFCFVLFYWRRRPASLYSGLSSHWHDITDTDCWTDACSAAIPDTYASGRMTGVFYDLLPRSNARATSTKVIVSTEPRSHGRGTNTEASQHRELTLEKKIIPLVPLGIEPVTFPSRVRHCGTQLSSCAPSSSSGIFFAALWSGSQSSDLSAASLIACI